MTSPIIHARSSVARCGGDISLHTQIHQLIDSSKVGFCDARHRAVFHHIEGVEYLTEQIAESGEDLLLLNTIGVQHLREDMGGALPSASDWSSLINLDTAPKVISGYQEAEISLLRRYGGTETDYAEIIAWLVEPIEWTGGPHEAGIFRHHSFGCFDTERQFGYEILNCDGKRVPVRYIAENWIRRVYGKIPSLSDWCLGLPLLGWMNKGYSLDDIKQAA